MKITRIETIPVRVPIRPDLAIRGKAGYHAVSPFLLVKVHTDEGITGLGEVSATPRWSGEDQVSAAYFIGAYLALLWEGEDPADIDGLTKKLRLGLAGNPFTKAALEMALWDIAGKRSRVPVYGLLGGAVRESVPTKWSISGLEPERAACIALWAREQGFRTMKVKVGIDPEQDVARVKAVREAVGPEIRLGVDANGGWSFEVAVATVRRLLDCGIDFVEQPTQTISLAEVRRQIPVPVIADESVYTLEDAVMLSRAAAADVFSVYVGKAGGIAPAREIVAFAQAAGLAATIGSNLEMGVGSAAMIHLALATSGLAPDRYPCDIIGPLFYEDDLLREPLPIRGGEAHAPLGPGLGVELDEAKIERYRVK